MTVNGNPIQQYNLPRTNVNISYSQEFEEQEARIFAGLGLAEYDALPGDPVWCDDARPVSKAEVLTLYRMHYLVEAVRVHAANKQRGR